MGRGAVPSFPGNVPECAKERRALATAGDTPSRSHGRGGAPALTEGSSHTPDTINAEPTIQISEVKM